MTNLMALAAAASIAFTTGIFVALRRRDGISPRAPVGGFKPSPSPTGLVGGLVRKGGINPWPSQIVDRPPDPGAIRRRHIDDRIVALARMTGDRVGVTALYNASGIYAVSVSVSCPDVERDYCSTSIEDCVRMAEQYADGEQK